MVKIKNHKFFLDPAFVRKLSPVIKLELGKLSQEKQLKFQEIYQGKRRCIVLAYICLLFFPGTHYAFLGNWPMQVLFWVTIGGGLIWWMFDIYRLKSLVKKANLGFQKKILLEINAVNVFHKHQPGVISSRLSIRVA